MKTFTNFDLNIIRIIAFIIFLFTCEAMEAQAGRMHRATRRRTAVVVSSATHSKDQQQAQATAATPAPVQTAPAPAPAPAPTTTPPPASTQALLPTGSVVTSLPTGCASKAIGGEEYYICGANYYKAAYQEGSLVYVTVKPPQ